MCLIAEGLNLSANPVIATDYESAVHTCVSFPGISGMISTPVRIALEARTTVP